VKQLPNVQELVDQYQNNLPRSTSRELNSGVKRTRYLDINSLLKQQQRIKSRENLELSQEKSDKKDPRRLHNLNEINRSKRQLNYDESGAYLNNSGFQGEEKKLKGRERVNNSMDFQPNERS